VVERIGHAYLEGPESSAEFNDPGRVQAEAVSPNSTRRASSEADRVYYPPGTSKSNKIEHRPFSFITELEGPAAAEF